MKKFQFAAGLLALGLLASCSSDAPELASNTPNNGGDNFGEDAYIGLRISTSDLTRVDDPTTEYGSDAENKISDLTVFLMDQSNGLPVLILNTTEITKPGTDGSAFAYFNVGTSRMTRLEHYITNDVTVKVAANLNTNCSHNYSSVDFWKATHDGIAPKTYFEDHAISSTWKEDHFVMSNNDGVKGKFSAKKNESDETINHKDVTLKDKQESVWILNNGDSHPLKIELTRLATRFDLNDLAESYTIGSGDDAITLKVESVRVNTHETSAYLWQKSTETGTTPASNVNFGTDSEWTDDFVNKTLAQHASNLTTTTPCYAHPHYVAELPDGDNNYHRASYIVVKASFESSKLPENKDKNVYAFEGVLCGTYADLVAWTLTDAQKADLAFSNFIQSAKTINNETQFIKDWEKNDMVDIYKPESGKYYTYYNKVLTNVKIDPESEDNDINKLTEKNTDLSRNTIYKIGINGFLKLGQQGSNLPHDPSGEQMVWIDLDVQVKDWGINYANSGMNFGR